MRLGQQALREFDRAEIVEALRDRGPGEHRRLRDGDFPAGAAEAFDQDIATLLIERAVLFDDVLRPIESSDGGGLNGREGAIVEIRLYTGQGFDQPSIADSEADPPAG